MSKQHRRSKRQVCCLLLRQCCRFGQYCRSNVWLWRKDEISTQNSFDIVAVFGNKIEVVSTLLPKNGNIVEATFDIVAFDNVASTLFASVDRALRYASPPTTRVAAEAPPKTRNATPQASTEIQYVTDADIFPSAIVRVRSCPMTGVPRRPRTVGIQSYQQQCQQCTCALFCHGLKIFRAKGIYCYEWYRLGKNG